MDNRLPILYGDGRPITYISGTKRRNITQIAKNYKVYQTDLASRLLTIPLFMRKDFRINVQV